MSALNPGVEHYYTDHISRPRSGPQPELAGAPEVGFKAVLASRYRKILCISDFVSDQMRRIAGLHVGRTALLHQHGAVPARSVGPARGSRGAGRGEEFVALAVAYLIKEKGIDVAMRAVA